VPPRRVRGCVAFPFLLRLQMRQVIESAGSRHPATFMDPLRVMNSRLAWVPRGWTS